MPKVSLEGQAFVRYANKSEGRDAEWAIPVLIGRQKGMIGISAPTNKAADALLAFLGIEKIPPK